MPTYEQQLARLRAIALARKALASQPVSTQSRADLAFDVLRQSQKVKLPAGTPSRAKSPSGDFDLKSFLKKFLVSPAAAVIDNTINKGDDPSRPPPSTGQRALDIISRPLYASANVAEELSPWDQNNADGVMEALARGLAGKDKATYSRLLHQKREAEGEIPTGFAGKARDTVGGLLADIIGDPITYVPIAGTANLASKVARAGSKLAPKATERVGETLIQDVAKKSPPLYRTEGKQVPDIDYSKPLPKIDHTPQEALETPSPVSSAPVETPGPFKFDFQSLLNAPGSAPVKYKMRNPTPSERIKGTLTDEKLQQIKAQGGVKRTVEEVEEIELDLPKFDFGNVRFSAPAKNPRELSANMVDESGRIADAGKARIGATVDDMLERAQAGKNTLPTPAENAFSDIVDEQLFGEKYLDWFDYSPMERQGLLDDVANSLDFRTKDKRKVSISPKELYSYLVHGENIGKLDDVLATTRQGRTTLKELRNIVAAKGKSKEWAEANVKQSAAIKRNPQAFAKYLAKKHEDAWARTTKAANKAFEEDWKQVEAALVAQKATAEEITKAREILERLNPSNPHVKRALSTKGHAFADRASNLTQKKMGIESLEGLDEATTAAYAEEVQNAIAAMFGAAVDSFSNEARAALTSVLSDRGTVETIVRNVEKIVPLSGSQRNRILSAAIKGVKARQAKAGYTPSGRTAEFPVVPGMREESQQLFEALKKHIPVPTSSSPVTRVVEAFTGESDVLKSIDDALEVKKEAVDTAVAVQVADAIEDASTGVVPPSIVPKPASTVYGTGKEIESEVVSAILRGTDTKPGHLESVIRNTKKLKAWHASYNAPKQADLLNDLVKASGDVVKANNPKITNPFASKYNPMRVNVIMRMLKAAEDEIATLAVNDARYTPVAGFKPSSHPLSMFAVLDRMPRELQEAVLLGKGAVLRTYILRAAAGYPDAVKKIQSMDRIGAFTGPQLAEWFVKTDFSDLIGASIARSTIEDSGKIAPVIEQMSAVAEEIATNPRLSDPGKALGAQQAAQAARKAAQEAGASVQAQQVTAEKIKGLADPVPVSTAGQYARFGQKTNAKRTAGQPGMTATVAANNVKTVNGTAIDNGINLRQAATDATEASKAADHIFETVLGWFKPDLGYEQLRPVLLMNKSARQTMGNHLGGFLGKTFKHIPEEDWVKVWDHARGASKSTDPVVAGAGENVRNILEQVYDGNGLKGLVDGNSAVARAGIAIDDLNAHLRFVGVKPELFQFAKTVTVDGKKVRLSPENILKQWTAVDSFSGTNPVEFTQRLVLAAENAMVDYATYAQLAAIWGSKKMQPGWVPGNKFHSMLEGYFLPPDIAKEMPRLQEGMRLLLEPLYTQKTSPLIKLFDRVTRVWKTGVTIYRPAHHWRNLVGDVFMGWLDGLANPRYYDKGYELLRVSKQYKDMQHIPDLMGSEVVQQVQQQLMKGGPKAATGKDVAAKIVVNGKEMSLSYDDAYRIGFQKGIFPHSGIIEDLPGTLSPFEELAAKFPKQRRIYQPLGGQGQKLAQGVSEGREHWVRAAHWLYALEDIKGARNFDDLYNQAARRVRKYHPDGLDLTLQERRVMRRLFPFYSWNRKALPVLVEGTVQKPQVVTSYAKANYAHQQTLGMDTELSQQFPDDQLFPDWLAGTLIGPTVFPGQGLSELVARSEGEEGYVITAGPSTPWVDLVEEAGNPLQMGKNMLNPLARIPAELLSGHELTTGAEINEPEEYTMKNIPMVADAYRVGLKGTTLGGDEQGDKPVNAAAIMNWLAATGILDTGRYQKGGEFDLRDRIRQSRESVG